MPKPSLLQPRIESTATFVGTLGATAALACAHARPIQTRGVHYANDGSIEIIGRFQQIRFARTQASDENSTQLFNIDVATVMLPDQRCFSRKGQAAILWQNDAALLQDLNAMAGISLDGEILPPSSSFPLNAGGVIGLAPQAEWAQGELQGYLVEVLTPERTRLIPIFDPIAQP